MGNIVPVARNRSQTRLQTYQLRKLGWLLDRCVFELDIEKVVHTVESSSYGYVIF